MTVTAHPGNRRTSATSRRGPTKPTSWSSASASRAAAPPSAPPRPGPGSWCWRRPRRPVGPPRWQAATSTSAAGPPSSRRRATRIRADEMYKYLVAVSREPEHDKIRAYCDGSVEHFNWLEALGFQFERSYYPGKVVVPPGTEGLSYTGNEKVWPFFEQAKPAPRGHSVPVPGELGGASMVIDLLLKRAAELGVQIRYETGATTSSSATTAPCVGVRWKHFTETGEIKAKAVIIAAGGFAMNPEMVAEYTPALGHERKTKTTAGGALYPRQSQRRRPRHPAGCVGRRGRPRTSTSCSSPRAAYPPEILLTGVIVNKDGKRFVAEDSYHSRTSAFVLEQPDSRRT